MIYTPYVWPLLISAVLLTGLVVYARRFRDVPAVRPFQIMMSLALLVVLLLAAEISVDSIDLKILLVTVRYIPLVLAPLAVLLLALEYTGRSAWLTRQRFMLLLIEPVGMSLLALTTHYHTLFRYDFHLSLSGPFPVLLWAKGPLYWFHLAYSTIMYFIAYGLLLRAFRNRTLYFRTTLLIVIGVTIPWLVDSLFNLGFSPIPGYSFSPSSTALTGLLFIWAFWRYRLFNVAPVARSTALENLDDLMFVFDQRDHLVDFNRAAQLTCGLSPARSLGLPPDALPPTWAALYQRYADRVPCREEVTVQIGDRTCVYDLTLSGISDARQRPLGRLLLLHDITYRRQIEEALRQREQILQAVNIIAAMLLESNAWTDRLEAALDTLGHVTHVSRVYLFENDRHETGRLLARQRAEWVADDITTQLGNRTLEDPSAVTMFEQWIALLSEHQILHGLTRDFPVDLQAWLAAQDIRAILVVPIFVQQQWWGFIGFDDCRTEHVWSEAEIDALKTAAEVLGAAIQHAQAQQQIQQQQRSLATAEERERIGRELHDGLGQVMGYVNVQAQAARLFIESGQTDQATAALSQLVQVAQDAHADIRDYIVGVRTPRSSAASDWLSSLEGYLLTFQQQYGIDVALNLPGDLPRDRLRSPFTAEAETQVLGIIREALNNIRKYAGVRTAQINLMLDGPYAQLVIVDQGRGFTLAPDLAREAGGRFGVTIMRERATAAGGTLDVEAAPDRGTRLIVRIPLRPALSDTAATSRGLRVALVDDHPLFLDGLRNMLIARGVQIVGTGRDGLEAIELARRLCPDILLMDIHMPNMDGLEATRRIKAEGPDIKIVILTVAAEDDLLFEALRAGASGYLLKSLDSLQFYDLLTEVTRGEIVLSPGLASRVLSEFTRPAARPIESPGPTAEDSRLAALTARQREVLEQVARGLTYKEIGAALSLSEATIKYHMGQILEELHVNSRREATILARQLGLGKP